MGTIRAVKSSLTAALVLAVLPAAAACRDEPRLHALDFWLGHWIVSSNPDFAGHNIIETILNGCAVTERWLDAAGHAGFSVFWYDREYDRWKQVWVTDQARRTGGTKEKTEVREFTNATRIRFAGRYPNGLNGAIVHDRTTLTREAPDSVRQLIEVSIDGEKTWKTAFDGMYRRAD